MRTLGPFLSEITLANINEAEREKSDLRSV